MQERYDIEKVLEVAVAGATNPGTLVEYIAKLFKEPKVGWKGVAD